MEEGMAQVMDTLLEQTPIVDTTKSPSDPERVLSHHKDLLFERKLTRPPIDRDTRTWERVTEYQTKESENTIKTGMDRNLSSDSALDDVPLADPKFNPSSPQNLPSPNPKAPILILRQASAKLGGQYGSYIAAKDYVDANLKKWEASQKEPLVEIPIKRTKQYFAIIQEMEEYNDKRAAKALDGVDGRTMTEKEDGIKSFERFFGGLRSLGGREKFQGIPPWERGFKPSKWGRRARKAKLAAMRRATRTRVLGPADAFRVANATSLREMPTGVGGKTTERVVWRFEDVSWVKQKTTRPRRQSYAGTLDWRVQLESGVERYGPFGIGGGIEGVGGVRQVIERGRDGKVRLGALEREKKRVRREIIV
jgi:hypothetical protein